MRLFEKEREIVVWLIIKFVVFACFVSINIEQTQPKQTIIILNFLCQTAYILQIHCVKLKKSIS